VREFATAAMMDLIREDLAALGVEMDVFFSERALYGSGRIEGALRRLKERGLIYEGVLEPPKGKVPEDWEPREQTLFRSTEHGDDVDRPVKKSDGSWTYFAPDIAYHFDKIERGFDELIDVFGADHSGYVKRMKAAVSALSDGSVPLDIKLTQLVRLFKNGEPFKMSKRAGNFVTLRDVVEQVGPDVTRFVMLTRKNDAPLGFRFRQGDRAVEGQPGLLRPVRPCPRPVGDAEGRGAGPADSDHPVMTDEAEFAVARRRSPNGRGSWRSRREPRTAPGGLLPLRTCLGLPRALEPGQRQAGAALRARGRPGSHIGENSAAAGGCRCYFRRSCYSRRDAGRGNALT
jgi:arginyl-tRNA synthetase